MVNVLKISGVIIEGEYIFLETTPNKVVPYLL